MAVIKSIEFDDAEELESVTVKLTAKEAAFIAIFAGRQNGETANQLMPGGDEASSHLYQAFVGGVFNRLYDDGVNDWLTDRG